jgi:hypothetical protein
MTKGKIARMVIVTKNNCTVAIVKPTSRPNPASRDLNNPREDFRRFAGYRRRFNGWHAHNHRCDGGHFDWDLQF